MDAISVRQHVSSLFANRTDTNTFAALWHCARLSIAVSGKSRPSSVKHAVLSSELGCFLSGLTDGQVPTILDAFSGAGVYGHPPTVGAAAAAASTTTVLPDASSLLSTTHAHAHAAFLAVPPEELGSPLICLQLALQAARAVNLVFVEQSRANYATLLQAVQTVANGMPPGNDSRGCAAGTVLDADVGVAGAGGCVAVVHVGPDVKVRLMLGTFEDVFVPPAPLKLDAAVDLPPRTAAAAAAAAAATVVLNPFFTFVDPYGYRGLSLARLISMLALGPVVIYLATHTIKASYERAQVATPSAKIQRRLRTFFGGDWPAAGADVPLYYTQQVTTAAAAAAAAVPASSGGGGGGGDGGKAGGGGGGGVSGVVSKIVEMRDGKSHVLIFKPL